MSGLMDLKSDRGTENTSHFNPATLKTLWKYVAFKNRNTFEHTGE
jgi:hypothetical protein